MRIKVPQSPARLFGRACESVAQGDRRERELEVRSPFPPLTARPNRRCGDVKGWQPERRPSEGLRISTRTGQPRDIAGLRTFGAALLWPQTGGFGLAGGGA